MPKNDIDLTRRDIPPRQGGRAAIRFRAAEDTPRHIGVLLIPGFALLTYACAVEPYRAANVLAGRTLYRWKHVSPDGGPVQASNGVAVMPDQGIDRALEVDDLFVCAGGNPGAFDDPATLVWLSRQARRGTRIGGLSGGPLLLARAGLLRDRRCTIHFEYRPALVEAFPDLDVTDSLFEVDRDRCTASGGTATLDLMLALITERHGRTLAAAVGEWFLHTQLRLPGAQQRSSLRHRYDISSPALLRALERMEVTLEEPLARAALARVARVSVRQLERLFAAQLGRTIRAHYRALRLDRARALLQETTMPVLQVAMAAGFVSAAHFARAYRAEFGYPPRDERQRARAQR